MSTPKNFKSIDELKTFLEELHPSSTFSPEKVLEHLKETLAKELKKRGFFAKFSLDWAESRGRLLLELDSEEFNTTPVLFESLSISNFEGNIYINEGAVEFWLPVQVEWKHFDVGQNSATIFCIKGNIMPSMVKNVRTL